MANLFGSRPLHSDSLKDAISNFISAVFAESRQYGPGDIPAITLAFILYSFTASIYCFDPKKKLISETFPTSNHFVNMVLRALKPSGNAPAFLRFREVYVLARIGKASSSICRKIFNIPVSHRTSEARVELERYFFAKANGGEYDTALAIGADLLATGFVTAPILETLSDCCLKKFFFLDGALLSAVGRELFPEWKNGEFSFLALRLALLARDEGLSLLGLSAYAAMFSTRQQLDRNRIGMKLAEVFGDFDWAAILELTSLYWKNRNPFLTFSPIFIRDGYQRSKDLPLQSRKNYMANEKERSDSESNNLCAAEANIALEYCLKSGLRSEIVGLLGEAEQRRLYISRPDLLFYAYFSIGKPEMAYRMLGSDPQFNILNRYYRDKIVLKMQDLPPVEKAIVLSECYTADELNYARFYPEIRKRINARKVIFTCDVRALPLLKRSYPSLNFLPVHKSRELEFVSVMGTYRRVPGSDCIRYLDNRAAEECSSCDRIITVMHAIGSIISGYDSFRNLANLKVNERKKELFRKRLEFLKQEKRKKYAVGLSWRSSIQGTDRGHGLLKSRLMRLLEHEGDILWISCQYDGLYKEERKFFETWGNNFVCLEDVDQYNDLDTTATLYSALDLIVSVPTFSADFAACVGTKVICPTANLIFKSYCFPGTNINCALPACEFQACRTFEEEDEFIELLHKKLS